LHSHHYAGATLDHTARTLISSILAYGVDLLGMIASTTSLWLMPLEHIFRTSTVL
jgi:hypothetical protein